MRDALPLPLKRRIAIDAGGSYFLRRRLERSASARLGSGTQGSPLLLVFRRPAQTRNGGLAIALLPPAGQ